MIEWKEAIARKRSEFVASGMSRTKAKVAAYYFLSTCPTCGNEVRHHHARRDDGGWQHGYDCTEPGQTVEEKRLERRLDRQANRRAVLRDGKLT